MYNQPVSIRAIADTLNKDKAESAMRKLVSGTAEFEFQMPKKSPVLINGFTLIELLVVIALTSILLTLIFKPLVQSFNLTRKSGTQIETQTKARELMREISGELSNSVYVFDNAQSPLNLWFNDQSGAPILMPTYFTMVQYVAPARQLDQTPGATPIDPTNGKPMYSGIGSSLSGYAFPLAPGLTLNRIWIGLVHNATTVDTHAIDPNLPGDAAQNGMPANSYGNRWSDPAIGTDKDNRYTFYKAEVLTFIPDPTSNAAKPTFIPNLRLFHTDGAGDKTGKIVLDDPNFFYDNSLAGGKEATAGSSDKWAVAGWKDLNGDGKVQIAENWQAAANSLMPLNYVDMIALQRNDDDTIKYDTFADTANTKQYLHPRPEVRPLATFAPAFVQNDPASPTLLTDSGNEAPTTASPTFLSQYTHWELPYRVSVYRSISPGSDPMNQSPLDYYQYEVRDIGNNFVNRKVLHYQAIPGQDPALAAGDTGDVGPHLINGVFDPANISNIKFAFTVDPQRGAVNFSFPSTVLIHDATNRPLPAYYSPADVNGNLTSSYDKRYIDMRTALPTTIWNGQQLNPPGLTSPLDAGTNWYSTVRIVPGSEKIYGPDQQAGVHYGHRILYTRVASNSGDITGLNQYKINYEDVGNSGNSSDPRLHIGYIEFNSIPDTSDTSQPNSNLVGTNSLPLYMSDNTGTVDGTIPAAPIDITYSFQMNRPNDVVKVDYLTRELMSFSLEARLYDSATSTPQSTSLTQKIKVRNLQH